MKFYETLIRVAGRLVFEQRLPYSALRRDLGLTDLEIEDVRSELQFRGVAYDEDGKGLVWAGAATTRQTRAQAAETKSPERAEPQEMAAPAGDARLRSPKPQAALAERRQLSVMFCDLVDSTSLSAKLDPEDLREVVRAYQAAAAAVITQYEGHIAQYLGDGLLVYLGYPQAHGDDAQRAVHAGLGIVTAMKSLNLQLQAKYGVQLALRIGIHTGAVVVGQMGGGDRHEQLALGETPNIAARLEGLAQPNTVLISQATWRLVSDAFATASLGPQTLKGLSEPVEVWQVTGLSADDTGTEVAQGREATLLMGRESEFALLMRCWEQSQAGSGQVVLISGEAGIGKSSLVNAMRAQVAKEGLPRLTFRCSPYHRNSVLHPAIVHLQQFLKFDREDDGSTKLAKLEQGLKPYERSIKHMVPLFAALLSVPLPPGRYPALNGSAKHQRQLTLDALNTLLLAEAERQPILVLWEDLHWADPTTLEFLGLVVEQAPAASLLAVLTFRPDFVPPWPMRSHITPVLVNRLAQAQVEAMVNRLCQGKSLPAEVMQHIISRADGVPLYVEELTKALLESDLLQEQTDHYQLTRPLADVAIPMSLQDSLMARLDRTPSVREVAQLGAVIGREFSYEMLHAISAKDEKFLRHGLAKLVDSELVQQRGRTAIAKYTFKHALVQDAAYQSMLRLTRQDYHRRCAETLEKLYPELVQTAPELVAHHHTEAGQDQEAVRYWLQAGQRAAHRSAHIEAIAHLGNGVAALASQETTPVRAEQELLLQVTLGVSVVAIKGYGAAEVAQVYTRAQTLCQQVGETPLLFQAMRGLFLYYLVRGQTEPALALAQQLLAQADRQSEAGPQMLSRYLLGTALFYRGALTEAARHFEQAKAMYDRERHSELAHVYGIDLGVATRGFLALPLWLLGYPDQAMAMGHESITMARELGHPFSLVFAQCWQAWLHQYRQEADLVQDRAAHGISLAAEQGFPLYQAWGTVAEGWAVTQQALPASGHAHMRKGMDDAAATGSDLYLPYFLALLAESSGHSGDWAQGLGLLAEAVQVTERTQERFYEAELYRLQGELTLQASHASTNGEAMPQAEACFFKAIGIAQGQQAKSLELRAAMSLARLWQTQDKKAQAHQLLLAVYAGFTEGFGTKDLQAAQALLAELA